MRILAVCLFAVVVLLSQTMIGPIERLWFPLWDSTRPGQSKFIAARFDSSAFEVRLSDTGVPTVYLKATGTTQTDDNVLRFVEWPEDDLVAGNPCSQRSGAVALRNTHSIQGDVDAGRYMPYVCRDGKWAQFAGALEWSVQ